MRKKYLKTYLISLLIAIVWGYFSDLRHGEVASFIGRLIFVPIFTVILYSLLFKSKERVASR